MDIEDVGVPGVPERYYRAAVVDALPAGATDMYAVYEIGTSMCVFRDGQWWCSPSDLVIEVLGL